MAPKKASKKKGKKKQKKKYKPFVTRGMMFMFNDNIDDSADHKSAGDGMPTERLNSGGDG